LRAFIGRVNHRVFVGPVKEAANRVSSWQALGFRASDLGFALMTKMSTKCAGDEVLAGFGWPHGPFAEDG
jgi:hypothetical protein